MASHILLVIVYIIGFVFATSVIMQHAHDPETKTYKWDQPWVPGITRRDACAMPFFPIFFLLPAILWPLVLAFGILVLAIAGLWMTLGSATSCCGIPIPRSKKQAEGDGGDAETPRDLEMGAVADGEDRRAAPDSGDDNSDRASVRSAASAESERPPSYASLAPYENGGGETDGLLDQSTK